MKELFVIGDQTSKSLSPLIFNHWFKKYKIKAKYGYVEVSKAKFDSVLAKKLEKKAGVGKPWYKKLFKNCA